MKEKILAPLKSFPCFVLFMYLLGLIDMMSIHQGGKHVSVFELLVDIYVLCLILCLLPSKIAIWTKRLFYVIAYGLAIVLLPPWGTYQCFPFTYLLGNQPAGGDRDSLFLCDPLLDSTSSHYNSPVNNNPYLRVLEKDQYPYQNIRMARCLYPLVLCY